MTKKSKAIIFLKGDMPEIKLVNKFIDSKTFFISADGAANYLLKTKIKPDIIIGDLDSIKKDVLSKYKKSNVEILHIADQDTTDFEKALLYCSAHKFKSVAVFGALSGRADHAMNNFSVLKRYSKMLDIKIYDNTFEVFYVNQKTSFKYKKGETVSFLAMPVASGITTKGLEYKLNNETLEFGVREGTLNRSTGANVEISFKKGSLLLFRKHFMSSK